MERLERHGNDFVHSCTFGTRPGHVPTRSFGLSMVARSSGCHRHHRRHYYRHPYHHCSHGSARILETMSLQVTDCMGRRNSVQLYQWIFYPPSEACLSIQRSTTFCCCVVGLKSDVHRSVSPNPTIRSCSHLPLLFPPPSALLARLRDVYPIFVSSHTPSGNRWFRSPLT